MLLIILGEHYKPYKESGQGNARRIAAGPGTIDPFIPVIFSWFYIPGAVAIAAALTYRLIAFWSVRLIGFFWWQYLEGKNTSLHV